ncbi:MAG: DUF1294 domain-containing protein [Clostridiales bacterium]|nr:DUF1294 domain-containing protein [Clostridiales bacterium]
MSITIFAAFVYFCAINFVAILMTVTDKHNAKRNRRRVPESTLMTVGLLGGALGEYITMRIIRHKTLHKKFMIGLPAEIVLHILIVGVVCYLYFL